VVAIDADERLPSPLVFFRVWTVRKLLQLFRNNAEWAKRVEAEEPGFFESLSHLQTPKYLWIGCADSRVPANEITGLLPGELFVHRNVANLVVHTDLNCLSVMQYAVDVLKVEHIMVVGHYGCGGVRAAMSPQRRGLIDNWLRHIEDIHRKHIEALPENADPDALADRLCEFNVLEQARNVCRTNCVSDAWARGQPLSVHAWVYALKDGRIRDMRFTVESEADVEPTYERARARIAAQPLSGPPGADESSPDMSGEDG
jgi:carbonic anhydrase